MRGFIGLAGVLLLTGAVYLNSFPGAFHYDDFALMLENPGVTGSPVDWTSFLSFYGARPLTLLSFSVNYSLSGPNAFSFHLVNFALHLLVVALFYLFVRTLVSGQFVCLASALLFALHPLQTQAVNYVWSRSVLLMACFGLFSLLLVRKRPWLALVFFQLAIWSRGDAVVLAVLLIWLAPGARRSIGVLAAGNLVLLLGSLWWFAPEEVAWSHTDLTGYWLMQPLVLARYLSMLFWPLGLSIDHEIASPTGWVLLFVAVMVVGAGIAAARWAKQSSVLALGFLWLAIPFLPAAVIANSDLLNESRSYFALGGFSILVGWCLQQFLPKRWVRKVALACILLLLVPLTLERNRVWNDDVELWRQAARMYPTKERIHYNLGAALARKGEVEEAQAQFRLARNLNPQDDLSYAALGYCAEIRGAMTEAISLYERALLLNPENGYAQEGVSRIRAVATDPGGGDLRGLESRRGGERLP